MYRLCIYTLLFDLLDKPQVSAPGELEFIFDARLIAHRLGNNFGTWGGPRRIPGCDTAEQ